MRVRLASLLTLVLLAVSLHAQNIDPALQLKLSTAGATEKIRVIAVFDHTPDLGDLTLISNVASRSQFLSVLPMALVETTALGVNRLIGTPGIKSLYLDKQLEYYLHESVPLIKAPQAWKNFGATGKGVSVAEIDSGGLRM